MQKVMLDPVKEVTAAEKRVSNGFSTRSDEAMQMTGSNFYNNVEQLKHEEKELKEVKKIANGTTNKQNTQQNPQTMPGMNQQQDSRTPGNPYGVTTNKFWDFIPATGQAARTAFIRSNKAASSHGGKTG